MPTADCGKREGGVRVFRARRRGVAVLISAWALSCLCLPQQARAAHDAGDSCYGCHTLDERESDPGTSLINRLSRTFPNIKRYAGLPAGQTPGNLGCTFCHNDNGHTDRMKPAITHFQGRTTSHPVGFAFAGRGRDTNGEYLSTYGSATDGELDCVDCHDLAAAADGRDDPETAGVDEGADGDAATSRGGAADKYPEHGPPADPAGNPFMLRGVTAADEYDGFCRTCHRSDAAQTVKGVSLQLLAHADNAPGRPLQESDGTVLRTADLDGDGAADTAGLATTAQCTACHDTHYSSNRRLFNDGHEQHKTAGGMADDTPVTSGDCTTLCHYAGDSDGRGDGGSYFKRGHGMAQSTYKYRNGKPDASGVEVTMGYGCTACHVGIDPAQKPHANDTTGGTDQERYIRRFSLSGTIQAGDTGSAMGNPLVGVCLSCHQSYEAHRTAAGGIGCQDCHDEHAEGIGSNVMMIPEKAKKPGHYVAPPALFAGKAGTERITYDTPRWDTTSSPYVAGDESELDFFRAGDANGVCDSTECHGGGLFAPLSTWIAGTGTSHTGGRQAPGADCGSCHRHHGDEYGGWRARSLCADCHAAENRGHTGAGKSAAMHRAHAVSPYVAGCGSCHAHDGENQLVGTGVHGTDGTVNFGGTSMTGAFDYAGAFDTESGCDTGDNGCHSSSGGPGRWEAGALALCADCHASAPKLLGRRPSSGLHAVTALARHDGDLLEGNCVNCHDAAAPSSAHQDGTLNSPATAGFIFHANVLSYASDSGCRANESCHGGGDGGTWRRRWVGAVDALPGTAGNDSPGQAVCQNCHGDFSGWRWDETEATTTDHTDPYGGNAGDGMGEHEGCRTCHGWGSAAYDATWEKGDHGNGLVEMNGPDATHGTPAGTEYNDATGGCMAACHEPQFVLSPDSGWPAAYGDYGGDSPTGGVGR